MNCMSHEQHLLSALEKLGKYFGCNRDIYYTLGEYIGYPKTFLSLIESQNYSLSWLICTHCKYSDSYS